MKLIKGFNINIFQNVTQFNCEKKTFFNKKRVALNIKYILKILYNLAKNINLCI